MSTQASIAIFIPATFSSDQISFAARVGYNGDPETMIPLLSDFIVSGSQDFNALKQAYDKQFVRLPSGFGAEMTIVNSDELTPVTIGYHYEITAGHSISCRHDGIGINPEAYAFTLEEDYQEPSLKIIRGAMYNLFINGVELRIPQD